MILNDENKKKLGIEMFFRFSSQFWLKIVDLCIKTHSLEKDYIILINITHKTLIFRYMSSLNHKQQQQHTKKEKLFTKIESEFKTFLAIFFSSLFSLHRKKISLLIKHLPLICFKRTQQLDTLVSLVFIVNK